MRTAWSRPPPGLRSQIAMPAWGGRSWLPGEMHLELIDGAQELGPRLRGDVADLLDDRWILGPQIPVEGFNEALYRHTGTPFSFRQ